MTVLFDEDSTSSKAWLLSGLFALGTLATIAVIGLVTALLGRILGDLGSYAKHVAAALILFFGLYLLGMTERFLLRAALRCGIGPLCFRLPGPDHRHHAAGRLAGSDPGAGSIRRLCRRTLPVIMLSGSVSVMRKVCGVLVIAAGIYLLAEQIL